MFGYLFKQIESADADIEFSIKCSFLEIYMERIQDLLDRKFFVTINMCMVAKKNNLQVKEDKGKIYVNDCTEVYVTCPEEMLNIMRAGS
jgi:kinesin family protein 5